MENEVTEYSILRNEIDNNIKSIDTLSTFVITTVVAILTYALSQNSPYLFLVPFCIIIPISTREAYYYFNIMKISAYMIIFLEDHIHGLKWENRNAILDINKSSIYKSKK